MMDLKPRERIKFNDNGNVGWRSTITECGFSASIERSECLVEHENPLAHRRPPITCASLSYNLFNLIKI